MSLDPGIHVPARTALDQGPGSSSFAAADEKSTATVFEKQAGLASYSTYSGSTMWITTGKDKISSPSIQTAKLLGEVLETSEIKLEVQLPRCPEMKTKDKRHWLHFSTKVDSSEVNHWIQVGSYEDSHNLYLYFQAGVLTQCRLSYVSRCKEKTE